MNTQEKESKVCCFQTALLCAKLRCITQGVPYCLTDHQELALKMLLLVTDYTTAMLSDSIFEKAEKEHKRIQTPLSEGWEMAENRCLLEGITFYPPTGEGGSLGQINDLARDEVHSLYNTDNWTKEGIADCLYFVMLATHKQ